jgi:hypothetical protein
MRKVDTFAPHNDGHQWRKYGEKKINNTNFPRSGPPGLFFIYRGGKGILHLPARVLRNLSSAAKNPPL